MANANTPLGLIPKRLRNGSPYNGTGRVYIAPTSVATNLFIGDPVVRAGAADLDGYATIDIAAAASGTISGVVIGFEDPASLLLGYGAASTLRRVIVADDPQILFEIQDDGVGGNLAMTSVGLNASLIAGTGSTVTRKSGWMLDTSTVATTATLQLRIVEMQHRPDTENALAGVQYSKCLVFINAHAETAGAGL